MAPQVEDYGHAIERGLDLAWEHLSSTLPDAVAADLAGWLAGSSAAHQRLVLDNLPPARRPEVLERLLKVAHERAGDPPRHRLGLARAAVTVAEALEPRRFPPGFVHERQAEAWCQVATATRVLGDLGYAEVAMARARRGVRHRGADPVLLGDLLSEESALRCAQRRFDKAVHPSMAALSIYQRLGERRLEQRAIIRLSKIYRDAGVVTAALDTCDRNQDRLDRFEEPPVRLCLLHNLVNYHLDANLPRHALVLFEAIEPLYAAAGETHGLRGEWSRGQLVTALGHPGEGAQALESVRRRFLTHGMAYDAALVGLDVARMWAAYAIGRGLENGSPRSFRSSCASASSARRGPRGDC